MSKKLGIKGRGNHWPPTLIELEEDDDPDERGCEDCVRREGRKNRFSPQRAVDAFYRDNLSLIDSWCVANGCKWSAWDPKKKRYYI